MKYYFLIVSLFSIVSAQQHRIIIDQDCYPDVINLHKQSQSSLDAEAKVTTQEMQKRAQEDELEWSLLFLEFFPVQKQDLSPAPIFETDTRAQQAKLRQEALVSKQDEYREQIRIYESAIKSFAKRNKKIQDAKRAAKDAERTGDRLQDKADEAKCIAGQKSAEVDALQKAKL
jgi:hypothetical protein